MLQTEGADPATSSAGGHPATIARRVFSAAMIALAVLSIDIAESQAADDTEAFAMPSNGCGYRHSFVAAEAALEARARGPAPVSLDGKLAGTIPVLRTITLGTYQSIDALRAALDTGCRVGDLAAEILERPAFTVSKTRRRIALVFLSAADLGLGGEGGASRAAIYKRATQLGLELCPAEVAPQLRLQYPDQPPGEFLHIAMHPVATRRNGPTAFVVGNGGAGRLLIGSDARPERIVPPTMRFVFVRSP